MIPWVFIRYVDKEPSLIVWSGAWPPPAIISFRSLRYAIRHPKKTFNLHFASCQRLDRLGQNEAKAQGQPTL